MGGVAVYVEVAAKRAFAGAIDFPGWCRSGRTEAQALESLAAYAGRYAAVVRGVVDVGSSFGVDALEIVEHLEGGATTNFGAPEKAPSADERAIDDAELDRQGAILNACWAAFDAAASSAVGRELRLGPRGGGRSLEKMVGHVADAEVAYLKQLGARFRPDASVDAQALAQLRRQAVLDALAARTRGEPIEDASGVKKLWLPRYFVRRAAWHVLDHAWELEDRIL